MGWPRLSMNSLRARLSLGLAAFAVVFLATIGVVLDRAFQASVLRAADERIDVYLLALVGFAELEGDSVRLPDAQLDQRFVQPGSGLYGLVRTRDGAVRWRSDSTLGRSLTDLLARSSPPPGRIRHAAVAGSAADDRVLGPLLVGELGVVFQRPGRNDTAYTFVVALERAGLDAEVKAFRHALWLGLGAVGALMLLASLLLFRVVTQPLRRLSAQVAAIERGETTALGGGWPDELSGVTTHLDQFIAQERSLRERYRTLTDDLAHSLKTPLAVLRNGVDEAPVDLPLLRAQIERMDNVLQNRLDRVVVQPLLTRPLVFAAPVIAQLVAALARLYPDHRIQMDVADDVQFPGEARDLMELCGNLGDNACKYGDSQVRMSACTLVQARRHKLFELRVDNDGVPIPAALREAVLQRGVRVDSQSSGQGIGLAVVADLVAEYGGELSIETAPLGGARITVRLPIPSNARADVNA